jgi:hypothetical protein
MLEKSLQELFDQVASADQPPARVSIPAALQRGRSRLRRRRLGAAASPVVAASAVVAIALTGVLPQGSQPGTARPGQTIIAHHHGTDLHQFSPLVVEVEFGWLPTRPHAEYYANEATTGANLVAGSWSVNASAIGQCSLLARRLKCTDGQGGYVIIGRAPDIDGHAAYWGYPPPLPRPGSFDCTTGRDTAGSCVLAFEYARGGWAWLFNPPRAEAVRVADGVTVGKHPVPIRFPVQISDVPPSWSVGAVTPAHDLGSPRKWAANEFLLQDSNAAKPADTAALMWVSPSNHPALPCKAGRGSITRVINGYKVVITYSSSPRSQSLCTADANGMAATISESPGVAGPMSVTGLFSRMTFFGRDPANWTTKPLRSR